MIDPELLRILVCPETRQHLRPADADLLDRLNERIRGGGMETRGGAPVTEVLEAGLVREDGGVLYPIRDGIPVMLIDEAIVLRET